MALLSENVYMTTIDFDTYCEQIAECIPPNKRDIFWKYMTLSRTKQLIQDNWKSHMDPWVVSGAFTDEIYPSPPTYVTRELDWE